MSPLPSTVLKILYTLLASLQQPLAAVSYSNLLNFKILGNQGGLGAAMMDPGRAEQQLRISSNRTHCPHCAAQLREPVYREGKKPRGIVKCQIVAEPKTLQGLHVSRWCVGGSCAGKGVKYWCGFLEKPTTVHGRRLLIKSLDAPHADFFFLNKSWGVVHSWLRRWRYRMFLHRASFLGEEILLRLLDASVQVKVRQHLSAAWAREILWRRAVEVGGAVCEDLPAKILSLPIEKLVESCWSWYEPHMFARPGRDSWDNLRL